MKLVIAEKPSVAMSICKVLGVTNRKDGYAQGNGYYVSWCVGHLVEFVRAESYDERYSKWSSEYLPIIPTEWQYKVSNNKEKQMSVISKLMHSDDVDTVICATDAGREGELIFRLVYNFAKCNKPIKRLWISSLEDEAIRNGFENLQDGANFENLYQAALCRSKADWLVGINATMLFSVLYGLTLNVGRVMSPTLAMIVKRNNKILKFKSEPFYNIVLTTENGAVLSSKKYTNQNQAQYILNQCNKSIFIETVENKLKLEKPPKLYDLTTLQREANRKLGFTANQTLEYTQTLYEKKLCTYPRTDSRFLTEDMQNGLNKIIDISILKLGVATSSSSNISNTNLVINSSKVTDHHAIIPTLTVENYDIDSLSYGEKSVLQLIMSKLLCAVANNHEYNETIVTGKCGNETFTCKGKTIVVNGFKDFIISFEEQKKPEQTTTLPIMANGEILDIVSSNLKTGKTSPPKNYTDDTILNAMENANNAEVDMDMKGIGTPATRANILEKLIKSGLIERTQDKSKKFIPTDKGIALISVLPEMIQSPLLTAEWESKLKSIEQGNLSSFDFLNEINQMTIELVQSSRKAENADAIFSTVVPKRESLGQCPRCGKPVYENKKGFCCSSKECKFAIWKENRFFTMKKKKPTANFIRRLLETGKAPLKGCSSSKTDKKYDCIVMLADDGGDFVNFTMEFIWN